ncbi:hypothetical protein FDB55_03495 [Clostridium botulinum]|nr:hypothetical protein [Clostridium botulinum]NFL41815.1 hypothetical protein [Clostridium botulinum]NFN20811.1 hypothetical protein [Clostridium botulinum]NFN42029.1 hypothetical protein [Clostridium botulinum]NFO40920.1 hypothetical protein [Clostridium botulinum]
MKTIIIYDNKGFILMQQSGGYRKPEGGIQFIEVEVPLGKYAVSVDTKTNTAIYKDMPKGETDILKEEIEMLKSDLAELTFEIAIGGMN